MDPETFEALARGAAQVGLDHLLEGVPPAYRAIAEAAVNAGVGALAAALRPHCVRMEQAPGSVAILEIQDGG